MLTLGINYSRMHDSSACIVRDGKLLFAIAEERVSRVKHDASFPVLSIKACLDSAGVRASELDFVCFGWPPPRITYGHDLADFVRGRHPISYFNVFSSTRHFATMVNQGNGWKRFQSHFGPTKARPRFIDHHFSHAISTFALLWLRRSCGSGRRRPRLMGGNIFLARSFRPTRSREHDPMAKLPGPVLCSLH